MTVDLGSLLQQILGANKALVLIVDEREQVRDARLEPLGEVLALYWALRGSTPVQEKQKPTQSLEVSHEE